MGLKVEDGKGGFFTINDWDFNKCVLPNGETKHVRFEEKTRKAEPLLKAGYPVAKPDPKPVAKPVVKDVKPVQKPEPKQAPKTKSEVAEQKFREALARSAEKK